MKNIDYGRLEELVIRPGIEERLVPLALYRGNLSLGDVHKRWNMMIAAMLAELRLNEIKILWEDPTLAKLCFPNLKNAPELTSMYGWLGRMENHRDVIDNIPGLWDYIRSLGGWRFSNLAPVPRDTDRYLQNRPWRSYTRKRRTKTAKPNKKPTEKRQELFYPYLIVQPEFGVNEGQDLLLKINNAVPAALPDQIRADVCQDLAVAILSGDMAESELDNEAILFVKKVFKMYPTKWGPISLDATPP
ncbi:MAG: hypothetical protein ACR2PS_05580 [Pseudomonadales bacterium]